MSGQAPAGYYPDPHNPAVPRYWDGAAWGPAAPPYPVTKPHSAVSVISCVLFVVGIFVPLLVHSAGLVCGIIGIRETKADGPKSGRSTAVLGTILNGVGVGLALFVVFVFAFGGMFKN